jgi:cell division protease FtsH
MVQNDLNDKNTPRKGIKFQKKEPGKRPKRQIPRDDETQWRKRGGTFVIWLMLLLGLWLFYQLISSFQSGTEYEISYMEYRNFLENGKIESAVIVDREMKGVLRADETLPRENKPTLTIKRFKVYLPEFYKEELDEWNKFGMKYTFKPKEVDWSTMFIWVFPFLLPLLVMVYFMRRFKSGGTSGIFSFGKSRAKLLIENKPKVTFENVAGADEAKQELQEIIEFLKAPEKFQRLGGKIPKGALLVGPPGTGKTLLARAVAGEAGVPFYSISGADFVEMFVGVGASRVRDLFEQGKKNAPCIIFIDEIDAVGRSRGAGIGGGHDEREQTLNQLLVEMDGFEHNEGVILIAATNRPDVLDNALLRPGRFDRQIVVDRPDVRGRLGILKVHTKNIPLKEDVDLEVIAKGTPGLAGADLANIVNEAALHAARVDKKKVDNEDFENAKDKVMMGAERKTLIISDDEKRSTAYHEAGHVLASILTPGSDPIHKVTIIPRGRALGVTTSLPIDERHTYSKNYCEAVLIKMMGGRAAEKIVFNTFTTGAGNDIEQATNLARKMVCEWGMSDKIGPLTFGKKDEEIFLGREIATRRDFSEQTARIIDDEIKLLVSNAEIMAVKLLQDNVNKLHRLADELLKNEMLDSSQIECILKEKNGEKFIPSKRKSTAKRPKKEKVEHPEIVSPLHKKQSIDEKLN